MATDVTTYVKTLWTPGLAITQNRMNHIESQIEALTNRMIENTEDGIIHDIGTLKGQIVSLGGRVSDAISIANDASTLAGNAYDSSGDGRAAWEMVQSVSGVTWTLQDRTGKKLGEIISEAIDTAKAEARADGDKAWAEFTNAGIDGTGLNRLSNKITDFQATTNDVRNAYAAASKDSLSNTVIDIYSRIQENKSKINAINGADGVVNEVYAARTDSTPDADGGPTTYDSLKLHLDAIEGTLRTTTTTANAALPKNNVIQNLSTYTDSTVLSSSGLKTILDTYVLASNIVNNLTTSDTNKVLSAAQGEAITTAIANAQQNAQTYADDNKVAKTSIANNLTTTTAGSVLDARQGKTLKDAIDSINEARVSSVIKETALVEDEETHEMVEQEVDKVYNSIDDRLENIETMIITNDSDITDRVDRIDNSSTGTIAGLNTRVTALETEVDMTSQNSRIDNLATELSNAHISSVVRTPGANDGDPDTDTTYGSLDARLEAIETHAAAARTDINTIAGELAMVDHENIVNTNTRVDTLENDLRTMAAELNMIDGTTIRDTNTRIDDIESEINAAHRNDVTNDTLDNRFDAAESRLGTIESDLNTASTGLKARITTAESDIDTLEAELNTASTGIKARLTIAEGDIDALEAELDTATTGVKARITALETTVDTANTGLSDRMTSAETRLNALDTTETGAIALLQDADDALDARLDAIDGGSVLDTTNGTLATRVNALETTVDTQTTGLSDRMTAAETAIALKADSSTMTDALSGKANTTDVSLTEVKTKTEVVYTTNASGETVPSNSQTWTIVDRNDYLLQNATDDKYYYWKHISGGWHLMGGAGGSGNGTSSGLIVDQLPAVEEADDNTDYFMYDETTETYLHYRFATIDNVKQAILIGTDPSNIKQYNMEKITDGDKTYLRLYEFNYGEGNAINLDNNAIFPWVASTSYDVDDLVLYQGYFYKCTSANNDAEWTSNKWERISDIRVVSTVELPRGGGGSSTGAVTRFIRLAPTSITTIQNNDPIYIHFFYSCVDPTAGDFEGRYTLTDGNGVQLLTGVVNSGSGTDAVTTWPQDKEEGQIYDDGYGSIDVSPYCVLGKNTFNLEIITGTNESFPRSWTVDIKQLNIESTAPETTIAAVGETIDLAYTPYGAMQKTLIVKVDGTQVKSESLGAGVTGTEQTCTIPAQSVAGAHTIELYLSATINGETKTSDPVIRDYIWYDAEDENAIIIASPYRNSQITTTQYSEIVIPYTVYKANTNNFTVEYYYEYDSEGENAPFDTVVLNNTNSGTLRYIPTEASLIDAEHSTANNTVYVSNHITIKVENTTLTFSFVATPMSIDIAPVAGEVLDFNPMTLNNNSVNRLPSYLSVSDNFNWSSNWEGENQDSGGGYRTDKDGKCFVIKAGTYAEIDYKMFKQYNVDAGDGTTRTTSSVFNNGAEMKIIFKVTDVRDASAIWFSNTGKFTALDDTEVGIQLSAHEGFLKTDKATGEQNAELPDEYKDKVWSKTKAYAVDDVVVYKSIIYKCIKAIAAPAEGTENSWNKKAWQSLGQLETEISATNSYLYFPYSEEDKIELDININQQGNNQNFIMSYEDGVPSKAYPYNYSAGGDILYHVLNNESTIRIGSPDCDVHIYRLRIYNKSLSTNEILKNFIADGETIDERIERYNRNSIYYNPELNDGNGGYTPYKTGAATLDPYRLAERIPDVKILMLDTPRFTTGKKDFVKNSTLRCIQATGGKVYPANLNKDNWYFFNGYHAGQGTTSDNYGQSARNVDFLFECDGTHAPTKKGNLATTDFPDPNYISGVAIGANASVYDEREKNWSLASGVTPDTCQDWMGDHCKISLTHFDKDTKAVVNQDTSIPNNYFNLKVNVASSENVNNALFQKRYNDFLPYTSPAKARDARIKNDMEFVPAVLFIRENDSDTSTHKEFNDTNWHFYALGNIGDSKKTDYTRAYDPTDMNEFTIEISDNNTANSQFQSGVFYSDPTDPTTVTVETTAMADDPNIDQDPMKYIYPITSEQWNATDGNGEYINYRHKTLSGEAFDGDHSFEFRYACKGDYRDGDFINDTNGNSNVPNTDPETMGEKPYLTNDEVQEGLNRQVWEAFYEWIVTSTKEQFKSEATLWFVPSAVEFFYAFTHYYTMMDNRAKNTFWHFAKTGTRRAIPIGRAVPALFHVYEESDGNGGYQLASGTFDNTKQYYTQYAFDLWVYDTDTACGIDNNGELSFPYGKEDRDYRVAGQAASGWAFNGSGSIFWRRLSDSNSEGGFADEISALMRQENANCFATAQHLINEFDEFQDCFPEEIWRLDIERKYIRTFTGASVDNSITTNKQNIRFLRAMMQGRKKYQRRQWVRNQAVYFGSKYGLSNVRTAEHTIEFNIYTPSSDGVTELAVPVDQSQLVIRPYQDMYIDVAVGNSTTNLSTQDFKRAKAGERVVVDCRSGGSAQETRVYIFGGEHIAALENLAPMYTYSGSFGQGKHLKVLDLGSDNPNYNNPRFTSISINENMPLLETFSVKNCNRLAQSIDLHLSNNLRVFEAEGSLLTGISLPDYSSIETLHLPNTVTSVALNSARALTDFYIKNKTTGQIDYSNLITLNINDSDYSEDINWLNIASQTLDQKINWLYLQNLSTASIQNITELEPFYEKKRALEVNYGDDGELIKHVVLSGTIDVTGEWSEVEKETYENAWSPNLHLTVIDDSEHKKTKWKVEYVYEIDGVEQVYSTYVNNNADIVDIYDNGTIELPTRPSTMQYDYTFGADDGSGYVFLSGWKIQGDTQTLADKYEVQGYVDRITSNLTRAGGNPIIAVFHGSSRKYPVKWYMNPTDNTPVKAVTGISYGAGTTLEAPTVSEIRAAGFNTATYSFNRATNPVTVTYRIFKGWQHLPINIAPASASDTSVNIYADWLTGTVDLPTLFADNSEEALIPKLYVAGHMSDSERAQYLTPGQQFMLPSGYDGIDNTGRLIIGDGTEESLTMIRGGNESSTTYSTVRFAPRGTTYPLRSTVQPLTSTNNEFTIAIDYAFNEEAIEAQSANESILAACYEDNGTTISGFRLYYRKGEGVRLSWGNTAGQDGGLQTVLLSTTDNAMYRNTVVLRHPKNSTSLFIYSGMANAQGIYSNSTNRSKADIITSIKDNQFVQSISWPRNAGAEFIPSNAYLTFGNTALDASSAIMVPGRGNIYWCKYWDHDVGAGECRQLAAWNHEKMYYAIEEFEGMPSPYTRRAFATLEGSSLIVPNLVITSVTASSGGHMSTPPAKTDNEVITWNGSQLQRLANNRIYQGMPITLQSIITRSPIYSRAATRYAQGMSGSQYTIGDSEPIKSDDYIYFPSVVEYNETSNSTYIPSESSGAMIWATDAKTEVYSYSNGWSRISGNKQYMNIRFPYVPIKTIGAENYNRVFLISNAANTLYDLINGNGDLNLPGIDGGIQRGDIAIYTDGNAYVFVTNADIAAGVPVVTAISDTAFTCVEGQTTMGGWMQAEDYWTRSPYDNHDTYGSFIPVNTNGSISTGASNPSTIGYGFNYSFSI